MSAHVFKVSLSGAEQQPTRREGLDPDLDRYLSALLYDAQDDGVPPPGPPSPPRRPSTLEADQREPYNRLFHESYGGFHYMVHPSRPRAASRYLSFMPVRATAEDTERQMRQMVTEVIAADVNGDGSLDFDEFRALVHTSMPQQPPRTDAQLRAWFSEMDTDGDGAIRMIEFFAFALRESFLSTAAHDGPQSLEAYIRQWDRDGDGQLDRRELSRLCDRLGFGGLAAMLLAELDTDHSGSVSASELLKLLKKAPRRSQFAQSAASASPMPIKGNAVAAGSRGTLPNACQSSTGAVLGDDVTGGATVAQVHLLPLSLDDVATEALGTALGTGGDLEASNANEGGNSDLLDRELQHMLLANCMRVLEMLVRWGMGLTDTLTAVEFGRMLSALGVPPVPDTALLRLAHSLSEQTIGTATLTVAEFNYWLLGQVDLVEAHVHEQRDGVRRLARRLLDLLSRWELTETQSVAVREVRDALTAMCMQVTPEMIEHIFDELDVAGELDGDGKLSLEELQGWLLPSGDLGPEERSARELRDRVTTNGAQLIRWLTLRMELGATLTKTDDEDGDGKITKAEFLIVSAPSAAGDGAIGDGASGDGASGDGAIGDGASGDAREGADAIPNGAEANGEGGRKSLFGEVMVSAPALLLALRECGFDFPMSHPGPAAAQALFAQIDPDSPNPSSIRLEDLNRFLLRKLHPRMRRLRHMKRSVLASSSRFVDVFRAWDTDDDALISSEEFARALHQIGFDATKREARRLFRDIDTDRSEQISFVELQEWLNKGEVHPPAASGEEILLAATAAADAVSSAMLTRRASLVPSVEELKALGSPGALSAASGASPPAIVSSSPGRGAGSKRDQQELKDFKVLQGRKTSPPKTSPPKTSPSKTSPSKTSHPKGGRKNVLDPAAKPSGRAATWLGRSAVSGANLVSDSAVSGVDDSGDAASSAVEALVALGVVSSYSEGAAFISAPRAADEAFIAFSSSARVVSKPPSRWHPLDTPLQTNSPRSFTAHRLWWSIRLERVAVRDGGGGCGRPFPQVGQQQRRHTDGAHDGACCALGCRRPPDAAARPRAARDGA
jgi:Ca2+-binding EF-hand superfamily protein